MRRGWRGKERERQRVNERFQVQTKIPTLMLRLTSKVLGDIWVTDREEEGGGDREVERGEDSDRDAH